MLVATCGHCTSRLRGSASGSSAGVPKPTSIFLEFRFSLGVRLASAPPGEAGPLPPTSSPSCRFTGRFLSCKYVCEHAGCIECTKAFRIRGWDGLGSRGSSLLLTYRSSSAGLSEFLPSLSHRLCFGASSRSIENGLEPHLHTYWSASRLAVPCCEDLQLLDDASDPVAVAGCSR